MNSIFVLFSLTNPEKHEDLIQHLFEDMIKKTKLKLSKPQNYYLSIALLPVYITCRAIETLRISNTQTDIDEILAAILEKSKDIDDYTRGNSFRDKYVPF